ncbi:TonB-dependent receptor [Luteimonas composti]|uniref:TonB-dependent receptor n=1 Tax=Luteimonas composti TaxID=398257 RepID=A0ABT6MN61_9GAMM|nr:TonB-dependent receptor [Luteimonas composti]MDH7452021.1 TonB-dependent receptor [Luteimonas composti]
MTRTSRPLASRQPRRAALPAALLLALAALPAAAQQAPCPTPADPDATCAAAAGSADATELDRIEVRGLRASLIDALQIKQGSMQIVDAIVAEDIGKFPDNNLVEALQRVTGVQTTDRGGGEVSTVSIRGLNDVTTTINGRNIFTASGRSVALADIPASLLSSVEIYKTRSASLIETGIAGQIDIHTHRPFDFDGATAVVAARSIHQEQNGETDPNLSALVANTWEVGGGRFGALANVSYAVTHYRDQSVTAGAMVPFFTEDAPAGFVPFERIPTVIDGQEVWQPGLEAGLPFSPGSTVPIRGQQYEYILSRDAIFASDLAGKRERPAASVSLQWAPDDSSEYVFETFYNGYRDERFNSLLFSFVDWWGALGPDAAENIQLYPGTNVVRSRAGVGAPYNFTSGDLLTGRTDSWLYALGGRWDVGERLKLRSELTYQESEYDEDFFAMRADRVTHAVWADFNSGGGKPAFGFDDNPATPDVDESDPADPAQWNLAELYDNALYRRGDAVTFTFDGDYAAEWGPVHKLAFGLRHDDRSASEGHRTSAPALCDRSLPACSLVGNGNLQSVNRGFFDGESDVPSSWVVANGHHIRDNADAYRALYGLPLGAQLSMAEDFRVEEATTAAYVQGDFAFDLGEQTLDGQVGLRYVNVDTDMVFGEGSASASASKLLPSLMLRYAFTPGLMLRAAYGETLRRPAFNQLNPNIIYVEDVTNIGYGTATGGNPGLEPTESKNYDLGLEWYFQPGSAVYATLFRREIEGMVTDFRRRVTFENYDYILTQPDNASSGELEGVELGVVWFPANLPGLLQGLGVQASYTALDSSQDIPVTNTAGEVVDTVTTPMFGISDSSYSVVLAYERSRFGARLSYVWRDDFLHHYEAAQFANPLGVYFNAEKSLDFQLSYDASENLSLTFDATNLTNELYQSYYQYPATHNFGSALYSRTFAVGMRYRF